MSSHTQPWPQISLILGRTMSTCLYSCEMLLRTFLKKRHSFIDNSNKKQTREVKLDDFDPVWAKYRHMHMSMMLDLLKKESQDFIEQNRDVASIADRSSKKDTKEIAAVITKLPDYQEKIAKYGVHTNLARELMNKITVDLLNKVAIVEQNMAVGQDEKGKSLDSGKLFKELIELMDHKKIS